MKSENRKKAFEIYKKNNGNISNQQLANILNLKISTIETWKSRDKWKALLKRKVGAPVGNQNSIGNRGGAPVGNQNARTHGFNSKLLTANSYNVYQDIKGAGMMEFLETNILILEANIIMAQKTLYVKDRNDHTKEIVRKSKNMVEYKVQFAHDKVISALNATSLAMNRLANMIVSYIELSHKNWDLIEEEQRIKVELLKTELKIINESLSKNKDADITIDEVITKSLPNITFLDEYRKLKKDKRSRQEFINDYIDKISV
ncbi:TPA: phage terminase small subunit [Clostridioides difficile]